MSDRHDSNVPSEMVGKIITVARQLESKLQELTGSDAAGIHAQTELAANSLSWETQRQLHYIASIRNQAAHEEKFYISPEDFNHYLRTADAVSASINLARQNQLNGVSGNAAGAQEYAAEQNDESEDSPYAVEQELFDKIRSNITTLGFFPFVGIVQLLFLMLSSMKKQAWVVFLSIVYVCSVILTIKGWTSQMHHALLYFGAGCFLFAHICVSIMSLKDQIFKKLPLYIWVIPVLNFFYLPCRWARDMQKKKFLLAAFGIGCFVASIWLLCVGYYAGSFWCLIISWASSICGSFFWGKKSEKNLE